MDHATIEPHVDHRLGAVPPRVPRPSPRDLIPPVTEPAEPSLGAVQAQIADVAKRAQAAAKRARGIAHRIGGAYPQDIDLTEPAGRSAHSGESFLEAATGGLGSVLASLEHIERAIGALERRAS